jgi:imidazole glycerol-phosphate synthase subunit HisH
MTVVVIDYEAGNLRSVETALSRLGARFFVTSDPDQVSRGDGLIFPGVGDASAAMSVLRARHLDQAIREFFRSGKPMLGICLGSQIILESSRENNAVCLGLMPGVASRLEGGPGLKIPHMGWNQVRYRENHGLFSGIPQNTSFYFVHSYFPNPRDPDTGVAWTEYGTEFVCGIEKDNLTAFQFHPEKSGEYGLMLLSNFLSVR